ncbi:MAG: ASPIC/UnbV domain-containing protein, partial [Planctomycetes bacterium]|nr:ASPIC/UnbV domain-containing protein [Planctomycetota bacterium]
IGARIEVVAGALRQRQYVRNGTGFLSGGDPRVHFGLGASTQAAVVITWPSGQRQQLDGVLANQIVEVVEPSFVMTAPIAVGGTTTLDLDIQGDAGLLYGMVLAFADAPHSPLPGGLFLPLQLDALSNYSLIPGNPFFSNPLSVLDASGHASTMLTMPNQPALSGLTLYATAATLQPQGFPQFRTVFPKAVRIDVQ